MSESKEQEQRRLEFAKKFAKLEIQSQEYIRKLGRCIAEGHRYRLLSVYPSCARGIYRLYTQTNRYKERNKGIECSWFT